MMTFSFLKRFLKKEKELPDLIVNDQEFRLSFAEKKKNTLKYIICNGVKIPIDWNKVVLYNEEGGMGYTEGFKLVKKRRKPKMFVAHWDVCLDTRSMVVVTKKRGLSVHFGIDNDGTIYQLMDTNDIAYHARGVNTTSVGVEIANGIYPRFQSYYKKSGFGPRNIIIGEKVHDKELAPYLGFYDVQIDAFNALAKALGGEYDIPFKIPKDKNENLVDKVDPRVVGRSFRGIIGHFHLNPEKNDPGIDFFKRLMEKQ